MIPNDANLYHINCKVEKAGGYKIQETYHAKKCTKCNEETKEYENIFTMTLLQS